MQSLVSIITATYNAASTLEACLLSVKAQEYPAIEHIIIDGGSVDGTVELLLAREGSLGALVSEPDSGVYDAWNKGLALARGDWIAFLGADDVYLPGAVSSYMKTAAGRPDAEYLSSRVRWVLDNGRSRTIGKPWAWPQFQRYMCTAHVGSMHRRSLYTQYGNYDTGYRIVGDYEFLLRPGSGLRTAFLPLVTVEMKAGGLSESYAALEESVLAQTITGGRSSAVAKVDLAVSKGKLMFRRVFMK